MILVFLWLLYPLLYVGFIAPTSLKAINIDVYILVFPFIPGEIVFLRKMS